MDNSNDDTPPRAAEPATLTAQCACGDVWPEGGHPPDCPVRQQFDTLAQLAADQQHEITAWSSTVADVEAALAGCPEADTLGERVRRMISGAVDAHLARMDACNRLTAATQRVEMLERQLEAISGEDAFVAAAKAAYTARTGADASTATEDDIDECAEIADAVVRAALAVATPADHLRGATNMIGISPLSMIAAERRRQIEREGWTPQHDDEHGSGELADAAACYAASETMRYDVLEARTEIPPRGWPFDAEWWKPGGDGVEERLRELTKAGALIVAEMERVQRSTQNAQGGYNAARAGEVR